MNLGVEDKRGVLREGKGRICVDTMFMYKVFKELNFKLETYIWKSSFPIILTF